MEAAAASSRLNNPNVINPYGTQTWAEGSASTDRPTMTQTFSPEQQALYNRQIAMKTALGDVGTAGAQSLQNIIGHQFDFSGAPAAPSAETMRGDVFDAMMSRVNEDTDAARESANSRLIAQGITPGTDAYKNAMDSIDRGYNDARTRAMIAAGSESDRDFAQQTQARKDAIAEILLGRQTPLNEINALISGAQVTNPFAIPGAAQNTNIAPPPIFGAAQAQYGADMDAYNAQAAGAGDAMSGLFKLGSAYLTANPFKIG